MTRFFSYGYLAVIYFLLYLPIVVLVLFSFNHASHSGVWHGGTIEWYRKLFHDTTLQVIAFHSIVVAVLAASLATAIGMLGAFSLFKYQFFGKKWLNGLIFVMIVIPDLVQAISLLILYHAAHISLGFITLLIAHITFCIPFAIMLIMGRLSGTNLFLFEAAKDLGATEQIVFSKIIVPLMKPGIIAAWLLSFTLSFDDVIISSFVTGPTFQILPLYIFSEVKLGVTPEINALCTMILIITVIAAFVSQILLRRKS